MMLAESYNPPELVHRSPLDTLVRKSSRRAQAAERTEYGLNRSPSSPLLHSKFARDSTYTMNTMNDGASSYLDLSRDSIDMKSSIDWTKDIARYRAGPDGADIVDDGDSYIDPEQPRTMAGRTPIVRTLSNASNNFSMPMRAAPLANEEDDELRKRAILERNRTKLAPPSPSSYHTHSSHTPQEVSLSRKPPSLRASSPTSVYSRYSFYQLDTATPPPDSPDSPDSPSASGSRQLPQQHQQRGLGAPGHQRGKGSSPLASQANILAPDPGGDGGEPNLQNPKTAWDFLHLGIQTHLASKPTTSSSISPSKKSPRKHPIPALDNEENLRKSAIYFEKSATVGGGCALGMLMWGLALRHGWGTQQNERGAFHWLRKAAEGALGEIGADGGEGGVEEKTIRMGEKGGLGADVQSELVLAIYEVGQCFFQGWGVQKDKVMAVSYYRTAARLGDADAQNDLAFCLANGKGCKKDKKEAAKWYRSAVAQGQSDVGLAWIYKEKYQ